MSVTAPSQPLEVREHPLATWRTGMRTVVAVTVVAAGALQVGGDLLEPDTEGYAEKLAWVAGHQGTYTLSTILWFLSVPLLIGVAAVFIALGRVRSPKLAWTGGSLLILGMAALGVIQGVEAGIYVGAAGTDLGPDLAEQMFTALDSSAFAGVVFISMLGGSLGGMLVSVVSLWRSRTVPRWAPVLLAAFIVLDFVGAVPVVHTLLLLGLAGVAYGVVRSRPDAAH